MSETGKRNNVVIGLSGFLLLFSLGCVGMTSFLINKVEGFKDNSTSNSEAMVIKVLFGMSLVLLVLLMATTTFGQQAKLGGGFTGSGCEINMSMSTKGMMFLALGMAMTLTILNYGLYTTNETAGDEKWNSDQISNSKKNLITSLVLNIVFALLMIGILYMQMKIGKEKPKTLL